MRLGLNAVALLVATLLAGCGGDNGGPVEQLAATEGRSRAAAVAGSVVSSLTVQRLVLKAERRIGRTLFEYDYQVQIHNPGQALTGVIATLATVGEGTTIVDGQVNIGAIAAGVTVTPSDTITLRHDRSKPFQLSAMAWQFSADPGDETASVAIRLGSSIDEGTAGRVTQIITSAGATAVSLRIGASVTVPMTNTAPLLLATDRDGALLLGTLAAEPEMSESSTSIALLWLWMKPISGNALDDQAFPAAARGTKGFGRLVAAVRAALLAGAPPASAPAVLAELNLVASEIGSLATAQTSRMRSLAQIATPRLKGSLDLLGTENFVTGEVFVNAQDNSSNVSVFNGTALYWTAYSQTYDGRRLYEPELLRPVTLQDAFRYGRGNRPTVGYQEVVGNPTVAYDLKVLQDTASRRANAVMIVRSAMGALLGTAALATGDSAACLNEFIAAVAPTELDAVAAGTDPAAVKVYLAAYRLAIAKNALSSLTLSAACTGADSVLSRLTRHMPLIQAALKIYNDAFAKVDDAAKVGEDAGTWIVLAQDFGDAINQSHSVGVCVAAGVVKPCAERYELSEGYPWIEGARGKLPLVAFDSGNKPTLLPSTLRITSTNLMPSVASPDTFVQMLRAGDTTLRLQDEPTGHVSESLSVRVEPGQIQYISLLGSATSGEFIVDELRALSVVANTNVSQFQGDVDFTWRVGAGSDSIVKVEQIGQRSATVKALRSGTALVHAQNTVTGRELSFIVEIVDPDIRWIEFKQGNPALPGDGKFVSSTCLGWVQVPGQPFGSCYVPKDPISVSRYIDGLTLTIFEVVSSSVVRPEDQEWATRPWIHFDVDRSRRVGSCYNGLGVITLMNPYSGTASVNGVGGRSVSYGPADLQVLIDIMNRQIGQNAISLGMSCASINANDLLILDIRPSFWVLSGVAAYTYTSTVQSTIDAIAIGRGIDKAPK